MAAILSVKDEGGNWIDIPAIKGDNGASGVYLGTDTPPTGVNVWLDPSGDASGFDSLFVDDSERFVAWLMTGANGDKTQYKPLYEKRISFTLPGTGQTTKFFADFGITNVENAFYSGGYVNEASSGNRYNIPFVLPAAYAIDIGYIKSVSFVMTMANANWTTSTGVLFFRYTKTTDTAKTKDEILGGV